MQTMEDVLTLLSRGLAPADVALISLFGKKNEQTVSADEKPAQQNEFPPKAPPPKDNEK